VYVDRIKTSNNSKVNFYHNFSLKEQQRCDVNLFHFTLIINTSCYRVNHIIKTLCCNISNKYCNKCSPFPVIYEDVYTSVEYMLAYEKV